MLARIFETETGLLNLSNAGARCSRNPSRAFPGEAWRRGDLELGKSGWQIPLGAPRQNAQQSFETGDDSSRARLWRWLFHQELARSGAEIVAIDVSADLLEIAKANCSASNVQFQIQDACELTYGDAAFDSVVGSSILHHLEIETALREIYRVLKPAGTIYFTEPNMLNPQIAVQKNIPWIKRKLGDSPDETAFFRWPLSRLLERTGYRDVRIDPFDFLHPKTPAPLINGVNSSAVFSRICRSFQSLPVHFTYGRLSEACYPLEAANS